LRSMLSEVVFRLAFLQGAAQGLSLEQIAAWLKSANVAVTAVCWGLAALRFLTAKGVLANIPLPRYLREREESEAYESLLRMIPLIAFPVVMWMVYLIVVNYAPLLGVQPEEISKPQW